MIQAVLDYLPTIEHEKLEEQLTPEQEAILAELLSSL